VFDVTAGTIYPLLPCVQTTEFSLADWRLINLPDANFEKEYLYGLWKQVVILLTLVALALFLLVFVLLRNSEKKLSE
jgi:hypothetical protein